MCGANVLTGKQIRAARVLLGWDAANLAERVEHRRETIIAIERGDSQPRPSTMKKIMQTMNDAGIDFLENSGVRFKLKNFGVLEGPAGFLKFNDTVFEHIRAHGGSICVSGVDEKRFAKYRPVGDSHRIRMAEIAKQRQDFDMKILVKEGDYNFTAMKYATYRWSPKEYFSPVPFYVFGDSLALISFENDPAPLVLLIQSGPFAEAYRQSFNFAWATAKEPPPKDKKNKK
jgi:DNA-binding XRE family transcriptional regulator